MNIKFNDEATEELREFQGYVRLPNETEVIRYALRFLRWAVDETQSGGKLCILRDGNVSEVTPFWDKN